MNPQLIVTTILALLDLAIRLSNNDPAKVAEYVELREQIRKALVAEANKPAANLPSKSLTETSDAADQSQV